MTDGTRWSLEGFEEALDIWAERESPDIDLRLVVTSWVFARHGDPYVGVRREAGFDNLWFGAVPGSIRDQKVVVCSYWIIESARTVRCDSIATLSLPI
jgi:hypothetical protein